MITGVRLTQLANGEPLLGTAWYYKNLSGIYAAKQRLQDLFDIAQDMGFEFIIDSIKPILNVEGELTLENQGAYSDIWPFNERASAYESLLRRTGLNIIVEIEFPTIITDDNWQKYADYFLQLVEQYNWVQNWQIMVSPETKDQFGNYKCSPVNYVRFMKYVYPKVKLRYTGVKIGGPGIFEALIDFYNRTSTPTDWLSAAIGNVYKLGTEEYTVIEDKGFLPYIDFFSIQALQNIDNRLSYEFFPQIIDNLSMDLKMKINKDFQIISINQGRAASPDNISSMNEQGYYDLREMLNCIKKGIIPFKNQLIDEFNSSPSTDNKYYMGLIQYFLGDTSYKPSYDEFKFLLNAVKDFNKVIDTNQVINNSSNVDMVSLINTAGDKSITIIWPKNLENTLITLQPHYARQYYFSDGSRGAIVNPMQIQFSTTPDGIHFIVVYQTINKTTINIQELEAEVDKKLNHTDTTLKQLISLLPNTYNKEVTDTNYYKILRAIALELADAKIEVEKINDNLYLDTAREEAIYNNFGTLINLSKKADWDYEKYKRLVKGVTKSLLNGPTLDSVVEAVKLFTNFNVNLYELYKNYIHIDKGVLGNVKPQYAFIIEIEKPLEAPAEQDSIYEDANYVINIVKPAHTIHLVVITLAGKENYREQYLKKYGIDFSQSDKIDIESNLNNTENIFGWKCINYDGQFKTADIEQDEIFTNNSLTNGGLFIGPRYVLYDDSKLDFEQTVQEKYQDIIEVLDQELEFPHKELYENVSDYDKLDHLQYFNELRFGFNMFTAFMFNKSLLNNSRLSPTSKLLDEICSELELFLKECYNISDVQEIFETTIDGYKDNYDNPIIDTIPDITVENNITEAMRDWELTDSFYHIHKKYTKLVTSTRQDEYYFPNRDLYTSNSDGESTVKVYINGLLEKSFNYEEIKSFYAPNKVMGIRFLPGVLYLGDIVSISYLWDQNLLVSNFHIGDKFFKDEFTSELSLDYEIIWQVTENIKDEMAIYATYHDEIKKVMLDTFDRIMEYFPQDQYKDIAEIFDLDMDLDYEITDWNKTRPITITIEDTGVIDVISSFIMLNNSLLNSSSFIKFRQEATDTGADIIEENFRDKVEEAECAMEGYRIDEYGERTYSTINF